MELTFAEKKDYKAVNRMYCNLSDMHHEWHPHHYLKTNGLYIPKSRYTLELENGWNTYIIAKEGRRNIGFCDVRFGFSSVSIAGIYVEPKYRGQGVATQMIEQAKEVARKKGFTSLSLHVCDQNDGAAKLYSKLGFRTTRVFAVDSKMETDL